MKILIVHIVVNSDFVLKKLQNTYTKGKQIKNSSNTCEMRCFPRKSKETCQERVDLV